MESTKWCLFHTSCFLQAFFICIFIIISRAIEVKCFYVVEDGIDSGVVATCLAQTLVAVIDDKERMDDVHPLRLDGHEYWRRHVARSKIHSLRHWQLTNVTREDLFETRRHWSSRGIMLQYHLSFDRYGVDIRPVSDKLSELFTAMD